MLLYLGTDPTYYASEKKIVHYPLIEIVPRDFESYAISHQFADFKNYTHVIVTSKYAAKVLFQALQHFKISIDEAKKKHFLSIGSSTTRALKEFGIESIATAEIETQEGMIDLLDTLSDVANAYFFYPRSSKARNVLSYYLRVRQLRHQICDLYDTKAVEAPLPSLTEISEIVFTSPSTVEAFFSKTKTVPASIKLTSIGPVTEERLKHCLADLA